MRNQATPTEAGRQYASAYAAHYKKHDLRDALRLYKEVIMSYPSTQEAGYSRTQVQNIVGVVVPREKLLDAQLELALDCVGDDGSNQPEQRLFL